MSRIGIIGGGAAGMTAAILAGEAGHKVAILENTDRLGKKILMTGNGKCNLTNLYIDSDCYYGDDTEKAIQIIDEVSASGIISFFNRIGVMTKDRNGYVYPYCDQASVVLDALRLRIQELGIKVCYDSKVIKLHKDSKGSILVNTQTGRFEFDKVLIATGGKTYPKTGSDGSGYDLARSLGHSINTVVPALTALKCKEDYFRSISGVRCEAKVKCKIDNVIVGCDQGELQITDSGISGIPVFQISRLANEGLISGRKVVVSIDLYPNKTFEEIYDEIKGRISLYGTRDCESLLNGLINKKLLSMVLKLADIKPSASCVVLTDKKIKTITNIIKDWTVNVVGSNDFDNSQVSAGGVPLAEVDEDLQSILVPGIYFAGEILDVDGKCGGYNLTWCWCSAMKVAKSFVRDL